MPYFRRGETPHGNNVSKVEEDQGPKGPNSHQEGTLRRSRQRIYIYTSLENRRKVLLCSSRGAVEADLLLEVGRRLEIVRDLAGDLEFLLEARVLCLGVPHEPAVAEEKEVDLCVKTARLESQKGLRAFGRGTDERTFESAVRGLGVECPHDSDSENISNAEDVEGIL